MILRNDDEEEVDWNYFKVSREEDVLPKTS